MGTIAWPLDKEKHLQLNKRNKEIVNKRFYASAVSRAKVLNYLLNAKQRTVLLACQRRMPGRRKRSNTQPTEAPSKRGRNTQSTRRVATEVSAPIQDTRELPQNLLTELPGPRGRSGEDGSANLRGVLGLSGPKGDKGVHEILKEI